MAGNIAASSMARGPQEEGPPEHPAAVREHETADHPVRGDPAAEEIARLQRPARAWTFTDASGRAWRGELPVSVYPPREDTALLDAVLARAAEEQSSCRMLEIGCGSGVVSVAAAARGWHVTACDVHPWAVAATRSLAASTGCDVVTREGGPGDTAVSAWGEGGPFDFIVWNLPYVDTPAPDALRLGPLEEAGLTHPEGVARASADLLEALGSVSELLAADGRVVLVHSASIGRTLALRWRQRGWATRAVRETWLGAERVVATACWRPWSGQVATVEAALSSTSDHLLDEGGARGRSLRAVQQTEGRGRRGRRWLVTPGSLAASWVLHDGPPRKVPVAWGSSDAWPGTLQLGAAVALADALALVAGWAPVSSAAWSVAALLDAGLALRWPNDLLVSGQKVAGCLLQARGDAERMRLVLGVGVNIAHAPDETSGVPVATALPPPWSKVNPGQLHEALHITLASWLEPLPRLAPVIDVDALDSAVLQLSTGWWSAGRAVLEPAGAARPTSVTSAGILRVVRRAAVADLDEVERLRWSEA